MSTLHDSYYGKLAAICLPAFMVGLDLLIISVALTPMARSFHAHIATVQWFMSGYGIGVSSFLITAGRLADIISHRATLLIGIALFSLCSLLVAVTPIADLVIVWRVFQGIGGAFILVSTITLAAELFGDEKRAIVMGIMISCVGLGTGLGPIVGGLIIQYTSWPIVFWINVPIGIIAIFLALTFIKIDEGKNKDARIDYPGFALLTAAMVLITVGVSQGNTMGWSSATTLCCIIIAFVLFIAFLFAEAKVQRPLIKLGLFRITNFTMANIAGFACYFIMLGWLFTVSLYLPRVMGLSPLYTGLSELPFSIVFFLAGLRSGKLMNKFGPKKMISVGFIGMLVATVMLAFVTTSSAYGYMATAFGFMGLGFVFVNACSIPASVQFLPHDELGSGTGVSMLFRWFGAAIGIAIMSVIYVGTAVSTLIQQVHLHSQWQQHATMADFLAVLLHHFDTQKLHQLFPGNIYNAVMHANNMAFAAGLRLCMWVLTGIGAVCYLLGLALLKKPKPPVAAAPAPAEQPH
jgi:EmrB/QacA subfamily drug resistance transporter